MVPIAGPVRRSRAESVPSRGCDVKLRVSGRRRPLAERPPCRRLGVACGSVHAERTEEITPSVAKARCRRQPRAPVSSPRREKRPTCLHAKLGEGGVPAERSSEFVAFPPREAANLSSPQAWRRRGAGGAKLRVRRLPAARSGQLVFTLRSTKTGCRRQPRAPVSSPRRPPCCGGQRRTGAAHST